MSVSFDYVAVEDTFGEVGSQDYLRERFNLAAEHIAAVTGKALQNRKKVELHSQI